MGQKMAKASAGGVSPAALLVAGAFFMEFLDGTVIATALPTMAHTFGVEAVALNIGISAYLLTLAVLIPASGWIADRFGARKVFTLALGIFTGASVLCGLANSLEMFVLMRVLQGAGGALMVPVGRLAVLRVTPKHQLITAIATLTWPALVAPIIGPPLGGFITSYANWRWIFFINLPAGLIAMALAWRLIPDNHDDVRRPFDTPGFLATALAMVALVCAMEMLAARESNGLLAGALLLAGCGALVFALRHFRRAPFPMIRLDAMAVPTFRVTMYGGSLFRASISAVPFLLPLLFQVGFGMDAFHSGLLVLALLACALLTPQTPVWLILLILFLGGVFRSIQFTGISTLAFADVPSGEMSYANTLFSTATQLAVGLGVTLGAISIRLGEMISASFFNTDIPGASFRLAFVMIALISLAGMFDTLRLAAHAGHSVSGKRA
ncbi:MFS transporter [Cronobacter sakazakii]|nr:MFS transporter [Cronobacter sakazakii]